MSDSGCGGARGAEGGCKRLLSRAGSASGCRPSPSAHPPCAHSPGTCDAWLLNRENRFYSINFFVIRCRTRGHAHSHSAGPASKQASTRVCTCARQNSIIPSFFFLNYVTAELFTTCFCLSFFSNGAEILIYRNSVWQSTIKTEKTEII